MKFDQYCLKGVSLSKLIFILISGYKQLRHNW